MDAAERWLTNERRYWVDLESDGHLNEWQSPEQRHLLDREALTALSTAPTLKDYSERYMARPAWE